MGINPRSVDVNWDTGHRERAVWLAEILKILKDTGAAMTSAGRQGDGPAPCTLSPNYPCILCLLFAGCHMVAASTAAPLPVEQLETGTWDFLL